ncbi:MAG: rhodanese-like domain-containing protein [Lentimicrobiaceae bacterium]|jgi:rhodanese-related sulfurtransferase|nr:rhodanese-like domain-containing protein [Lentimicrobiaceae bacterium]
MKKIIQLIMLLVLTGQFYSCRGIYENGGEMAADCRSDINQLSVKTLQTKIDTGGDYYLIDIRQPSDYYTSNIPGSVSIPRGILEFKIGDAGFWSEQYIYPPEKKSEIILYSSDGALGILAAKTLMQLGYTNVYNLEGGYTAFNPHQDPNAVAVTPGAGCGG